MKLKNSPIFVVGTPRSGTTLTAKILGRHSRLFMPGETHFFEDIYSRKEKIGPLSNEKAKNEALRRILTLYKRYNEPEDQKRVDYLVKNKDFKNILRKASSYKELLNLFMEVQMRFENKQRWGNNVPKDIFHIPDILKFYPNAKIIICVRDVRDFMCSYKNKWKITSPEHVKRLKKLYHPILTSLLWKGSMRLIPKIKSIVPEENLYILKYEKLVTNPESEIKQVCKIIQEDFEDQMLNVDSENSSANIKGSGIFTTSIGRWKNDLDAEDVYITQFINRREMHNLGYDLEMNINPSYIKMLFKLVYTPIALIQALYVNRKSRGPLVPYILKRTKSLILR